MNDTEQAVEELCRIVAGLGGKVAYELLGFHTLGFGKFDNLGMENPMSSAAALTRERFELLKQIPERFGIRRKL